MVGLAGVVKASVNLTTNRQLREDRARIMGLEFARLFDELQDEYEWLHYKWSQFEEFFGQGPERIDLLNASASNFFYFLKKLLFEDAMLHLSRLTDPPASMGRTNLTIMRLPECIADPHFRAALQARVDTIKANCVFANSWRNKRLAHTDLSTARRECAALPTVDANQIKSATESVRLLLASVDEHCGFPVIALLSDPWGATSLIHHLEQAIQAMNEQQGHPL